jgi:hypothetical protein
MAIAYEKSQKPDSSRITSKLDAARTLERECIGALGSKICKVPQKSYSGRSGRIRNEKRPRFYECYWAHFAAEIHLSE